MNLSLRRSGALPIFGAAFAILLAACSAGAGSSTAPASAPAASGALLIGSASSGSLGAFLTGASGRTLYVLTKDGPNTATCTSGTCAQTWPAAKVSADQQAQAGVGVNGRLGTISWPDGTVQVTYVGLPLYYFSGDSKAGDTNGQGVGGVWFVAPVSGVLPADSGSPGASSSPTKNPYGY